MKQKVKSHAPALENGLGILELLSRFPSGLSFTEIAKQINTSKSTLIRLLKVLVKCNYLYQNEFGRYLPGPNMPLIGSSAKFDLLRYYSPPILEILSELFPGNTAVIIGFTGIEMIVLEGQRKEGSVYMQEAGTVRIDFSYAPWGWIFYNSMTESQKKAVNPDIKTDDFALRLKEWMEYYHQHGYCFDREYFWSHIRRIAAPVNDGNGKIISAIAIGGNKISMPDENVGLMGRKLVECAQVLTEKMKYCT